MTLVVARQEHDRQARDAAVTHRRRRLAPRARNRLLARILEPRQVVDAGAADNAEDRFRHGFSNCPLPAPPDMRRVGKGALRAAPTMTVSVVARWWARGVYHRARIRATRWLCPPYDSLSLHLDHVEIAL